MSPTTAALVGVFLGQFGGWGAALIAARAESRRQRGRLALEAGTKEWETHMAMARASTMPGPKPILPPLAYVHTNSLVLDLIERGQLNADTVREVFAKRDEITKVLLEAADKRQGSKTNEGGRS
jgi:hypothetical protein